MLTLKLGMTKKLNEPLVSLKLNFLYNGRIFTLHTLKLGTREKLNELMSSLYKCSFYVTPEFRSTLDLKLR